MCVRDAWMEMHIIDRSNHVAISFLQLIKQSQLWAVVAKLVPGK